MVNNDNKNNNSTKQVGITFCELLAVVFIALKLLKVIEWSWWWVLSPIWIPIALVIVIALIFAIAQEHNKHKQRK